MIKQLVPDFYPTRRSSTLSLLLNTHDLIQWEGEREARLKSYDEHRTDPTLPGPSRPSKLANYATHAGRSGKGKGKSASQSERKGSVNTKPKRKIEQRDKTKRASSSSSSERTVSRGKRKRVLSSVSSRTRSTENTSRSGKYRS